MFNVNDVESSLRYGGPGPYGFFNQLQWTVNPGNDYTDIVTQIVSIHEFLHSDLNNITGFGFLLQGYAYLSGEESSQNKIYHNVLHELLEKCRYAHEAYATWIGINIFKTSVNDGLETTVLASTREYQDYYNAAESLVYDIPGIFFKRQVVSAAIRFCFQSNMIADYGIQHLDAFDIDSIPESEFPDNRFHYLRHQLPRSFFKEIITELLASKTNREEMQLLQQAMAGNENAIELTNPENDHLAEDVMNKVYIALQKHFEALGSYSLNHKEDHLLYFKELTQQLDRLCPFSRSANPLVINKTPDDHDRSVLIGFESETVMLSSKPMKCIMLDSEQISESHKMEILKGVGDEPHVFIMGRNSLLMAGQYQFIHEEDREWFESIQGPFTAIRYAGVNEGERMVVIIPFDEPAKLRDFLRDKDPQVPVIACVASSTAYREGWWEIWAEFFTQHCTFSCVLADISPLYYIEKVFVAARSTAYSLVTLSVAGAIYTGMLFQTSKEGRDTTHLLAPGSYIYCQTLGYYMKTRYPSFVNEGPVEGLEKYMSAIFSHIVREEHTWYYRSISFTEGTIESNSAGNSTS